MLCICCSRAPCITCPGYGAPPRPCRTRWLPRWLPSSNGMRSSRRSCRRGPQASPLSAWLPRLRSMAGAAEARRAGVAGCWEDLRHSCCAPWRSCLQAGQHAVLVGANRKAPCPAPPTGFLPACPSLPRDVAASYGVGALGGLIYLRLLNRSVDSVGGGVGGALGQPRLLIPVILALGYNRCVCCACLAAITVHVEWE